ncbi:protein of unknown function [Paraburkholderia kururiensis]
MRIRPIHACSSGVSTSDVISPSGEYLSDADKRCRERLVKAAARHGLKLRQNYNREAPHLARQIGRYAHAK